MAPPKRYPKSNRRKDGLRLVAREHATALLCKPAAYYDDSLNVSWGNQDQYEVTRQLGKGKYGEVYEGINMRLGTRDKDRICVIKVMRPVKEHRLRREVKILQHVSGGPNIVRLLDVVRDPETKTPSFVFDFVDAMPFKELQGAVTDLDVRYYIFQLLIALDYCHSRGIMHRDVKPGNVLIDHTKRELKLIDWGLADFYQPGKEYPVRVATRFYKGPELLVDIKDYTYSLDVWGVGCMMAALVFKKPVFFRGEDEFDQLVKVVRVLGTDGLYTYCSKYGVELDPRLAQMCGYRARVAWRKFVNPDNSHLVSAEAFDLLDQLLKYDHHERVTCEEALQHPYFDPVREGLPGFKPLPEPMAQMMALLEARRREQEQGAAGGSGGGDDDGSGSGSAGGSGSGPARVPAAAAAPAAAQEAMAVA
ncbi:hypothetical protein VOLCADRAFT_83608 [Volvox carteri f. nagariensis]|uniref:non-specific serine/threonine protein kinase n=1 Tax=Volvox carteri f. nagariensis TaxID=3068 RepID=D8UCJ8_VOLCA|nr:uncharacterized protein VOLCADRAFT_83608 [Volvox carteri f. nagariensis]EFJ42564.1 hypothetical protein VOLCADRAFT_83608 [Volvox carteri f. nagariensis]|eukprot:XP_002956420.1 hypothetical protein VOLCADRAFT_83608 [Volvox carteri f. nagariensis]